MMKFAAVCAIIVALALVQVSSANNSHEWGQRESWDRLLFREVVVKKYNPSQIVTADVSFRGALRVTYIKATDGYTDGNGGFASISSGGPGYTEATIHFVSQRGHGLNFTIVLYGHGT